MLDLSNVLVAGRKQISATIQKVVESFKSEVFMCSYSRLMAMDLEQTVKKTIGNVWMFEMVVYALKTYFSKTILQKKEKKINFIHQ